MERFPTSCDSFSELAEDIKQDESVTKIFHTSTVELLGLPQRLSALAGTITEGGSSTQPTDAIGCNTTAIKNGEEAEFELDSSPVVSSSEASSESLSDEDSDEDYVMLNPAEQARLLMAEGWSDDDDDNRKTYNGRLRTVNEKPDEIIEMPNITLTSDTTIKELGKVENIVDNVVLVTTKLSGEYQVLETSSVLCLEDKTLIGVVAEALGRVEQPFYSVRFTNAVAVYDAGISKGTTIFYVPQYSTFVLTEALKAMKGSDASNIHDEEIRAEELEFSDDEAEAEHKRKQKILRQANRGGRETFGDGFSRQPRQREQAVQSNGDTNREIAGLNYDDVGNEDDFYTPPARSFNLHEQTPDGLGTSDPRRVDYNRGWHGRHDRCEQSSAYRDCGQGRGRGGLGRVGGNGRDSVRRRGGHLHQSQPPLDFSLPPIPKLVSSTKSPEPFAPSPSFHLQQHFAYPHQQPLQNPQRLFYDQGQYSTDQSHSQSYPYSQSPMQAYSAQYQQHHSYVHATTENPSNGGQYLPQHSVNLNFQSQQVPQPQSSSTLPPGAFVNPAFVSGSSNSPMVQQYPYSFQNPYPKQYFPSR